MVHRKLHRSFVSVCLDIAGGCSHRGKTPDINLERGSEAVVMLTVVIIALHVLIHHAQLGCHSGHSPHAQALTRWGLHLSVAA